MKCLRVTSSMSSDDGDRKIEKISQESAKNGSRKPTSKKITPSDTQLTLRYPDGKSAGTLELIPQRGIYVNTQEYLDIYRKEQGWKKLDEQSIKQSLRNKLVASRE
ncbi:hypothetical protein KQX54_012197 [Cotesia glomerata]|uniref:Uncharacterized protein n=1 Tax=Cotesia glomerata TaxID=32391 RepID=A0AAV7J8P3_COTGL|nr:hypothetical protein KQX54_012197 [Cotesia glomerata]